MTIDDRLNAFCRYDDVSVEGSTIGQLSAAGLPSKTFLKSQNIVPATAIRAGLRPIQPQTAQRREDLVHMGRRYGDDDTTAGLQKSEAFPA